MDIIIDDDDDDEPVAEELAVDDDAEQDDADADDEEDEVEGAFEVDELLPPALLFVELMAVVLTVGFAPGGAAAVTAGPLPPAPPLPPPPFDDKAAPTFGAGMFCPGGSHSAEVLDGSGIRLPFRRDRRTYDRDDEKEALGIFAIFMSGFRLLLLKLLLLLLLKKLPEGTQRNVFYANRGHGLMGCGRGSAKYGAEGAALTAASRRQTPKTHRYPSTTLLHTTHKHKHAHTHGWPHSPGTSESYSLHIFCRF